LEEHPGKAIGFAILEWNHQHHSSIEKITEISQIFRRINEE
jgi:hypothetical protein